ncbi:MAG: aminotransferase class V-fold PLP-dependent enzyme [Alphaproteobacteria bacterium]|nr:aminotransferase class V-fold PLP-dependent enzyme [Alphaproteobacteria bacterium]
MFENHEMTTLNFLPGPIAVLPEVRAAFAAEIISHRSEAFLAVRADTLARLRGLTHARHCALTMGSATLANEMIAQQLLQIQGRGLVLSNGAFGERLAMQALRHGLDFDVHAQEWSVGFDRPALFQKLQDKAWVWFVLCETSTGMINAYEDVLAFCKPRGIRLCLDAISALGNMKLDLRDVYLASGTSGKGLGAFAGLALVFYNHEVAPSPSIPAYLDLGVFHDEACVPFTLLSHLLLALHAALVHTDFKKKLEETAKMAALIRAMMARHQLQTPAAEGQADFVWSLALPPSISAQDLGQALEARGVRLYYQGSYLPARNWIQLALMGPLTVEDAERGIAVMDEVLSLFP